MNGRPRGCPPPVLARPLLRSSAAIWPLSSGASVLRLLSSGVFTRRPAAGVRLLLGPVFSPTRLASGSSQPGAAVVSLRGHCRRGASCLAGPPHWSHGTSLWRRLGRHRRALQLCAQLYVPLGRGGFRARCDPCPGSTAGSSRAKGRVRHQPVSLESWHFPVAMTASPLPRPPALCPAGCLRCWFPPRLPRALRGGPPGPMGRPGRTAPPRGDD